MARKKLNLGVAVLLAMILGIIVGGVMKEKAAIFAPLGTVFISGIKMLVIPLVAVSIVGGAASLGETKEAGKVGIGTFTYYMATTVIAVTIGLVFGELMKPGIGLAQIPEAFLDGAKYADRGGVAGFWDILIGIIPTNPFDSLTSGNILQILFFAIFFGIGVSKLPKEKREPVEKSVNTLTEVLIWMIMKVMLIAPIGVFGLMAEAVGTFGYDLLALVLKLLIVYVLALAVQTFIVYPGIVKSFSEINPLQFIRKIYKAQVVALSTASSAATLPVTFEVCEEELGVEKSTSSFVLPLGATINMDGNAIYYALVATFFAQMYGIDLGITQYIAIIVTATVGSIGQAGVPGPSLLVVAVLVAAGLPLDALPLLFGVDRLFDMLRTAVNITGDASCAVVMQRAKKKWEKTTV